MRKITHHFALSLLSAAALLTIAPAASAGVTLGAEMNAAVPIKPGGIEVGSGYSGRLGYGWKLGPIGVTPEVGASVLKLGNVERAGRVFGGGRLGLDLPLIKPSVYAHYGYSFGYLEGRAWDDLWKGGPTYDMGAALDLSVSILQVGLHGGYVSVQSDFKDVPALHNTRGWVEIGMHAGLAF